MRLSQIKRIKCAGIMGGETQPGMGYRLKKEGHRNAHVKEEFHTAPAGALFSSFYAGSQRMSIKDRVAGGRDKDCDN